MSGEFQLPAVLRLHLVTSSPPEQQNGGMVEGVETDGSLSLFLFFFFLSLEMTHSEARCAPGAESRLWKSRRTD